MITDAEIESRMEYLGLTTNRVTIKQINSKIKNEINSSESVEKIVEILSRFKNENR